MGMLSSAGEEGVHAPDCVLAGDTVQKVLFFVVQSLRQVGGADLGVEQPARRPGQAGIEIREPGQHGVDLAVEIGVGDHAVGQPHRPCAGGIDVAIDFVSSRQTLEHGAAALGPGGRLITLGGSGQPFLANSKLMLEKELELIGSRYATKQEVIDSLELVARGDVWPLVTDVRPMAEAEALHEDIEDGNVIGRAALRIAE